MKNLKLGEIDKDGKSNSNFKKEYRKIAPNDFTKHINNFLPHFSVNIDFDGFLGEDVALSYKISSKTEEGESIDVLDDEFICIVEAVEGKEGRSLFTKNGEFFVASELFNDENEDKEGEKDE